MPKMLKRYTLKQSLINSIKKFCFGFQAENSFYAVITGEKKQSY